LICPCREASDATYELVEPAGNSRSPVRLYTANLFDAPGESEEASIVRFAVNPSTKYCNSDASSWQEDYTFLNYSVENFVGIQLI
jgi:hypothetical protein